MGLQMPWGGKGARLTRLEQAFSRGVANQPDWFADGQQIRILAVNPKISGVGSTKRGAAKSRTWGSRTQASTSPTCHCAELTYDSPP